VSDKGVSDLIDALGELGETGFRPRLSIVGEGPERIAILRRVRELGLEQQVTFTGIKRGHELARFLARHRVMAGPPRWAEPFGIVALEGIACGCAVVGTNLGGLPDRAAARALCSRCAPRIAENRAIPESARPPFHSPLKPAHDLPVGH